MPAERSLFSLRTFDGSRKSQLALCSKSAGVHATHAPGSDGTIDGKCVEVKTISPEKTSGHVLVKSQGDFEKLLIVRIDREFQFRGKLFDRSALKGGAGKFLQGRLKGD